MIAKLLISPELETRVEKIDQILAQTNLKRNHPDVLYFEASEKLGVEQAKKIKEFFSIKPLLAIGKATIIEDAANLTVEAQNTLLKTIEELPEKGLLILSAQTESTFLPTILSRCEIIKMKGQKLKMEDSDRIEEIEQLRKVDTKERFEYIETLKEKEEFLESLVNYFHQKLTSETPEKNKEYSNFLKKLLQAQEWKNQNVNIRAILEFVMLSLPK